jgi:hypothetical protein
MSELSPKEWADLTWKTMQERNSRSQSMDWVSMQHWKITNPSTALWDKPPMLQGHSQKWLQNYLQNRSCMHHVWMLYSVECEARTMGFEDRKPNWKSCFCSILVQCLWESQVMSLSLSFLIGTIGIILATLGNYCKDQNVMCGVAVQ